MEIKEFFDQIEEDIAILQENHFASDPKLEGINYAFNYWILSKMYNVEEEEIFGNVLEGNDKGIDCYAYFEDSKQLFLIQNKYYDTTTALKPTDVSHFLNTSLSVLREGKYEKCKPLQDLFTKIKNDPEHRIHFHLYITNQTFNPTVETIFASFNVNNKTVNDRASIEAKMFNLTSITDLYYGKQFYNKKNFSAYLTANNNKMMLKIAPKFIEYDLPQNFLEAYYIMTPVKDLYYMYKQSIDNKYELFHENIREYLGNTPINQAIKKTLDSDEDEKINFFFYNNGITIICDGFNPIKRTGKKQSVKLDNPQIINGCQTVNTIYEVLDNYIKKDAQLFQFKDVYVMSKILIKNKKVEDKKPTIYLDIVKYTNQQNNLTEKAFNAKKDVFINIQKYLRERGFLLAVKSGNITTFKKQFSDLKNKNEFIYLNNNYSEKLDVVSNKLSDTYIQLDKLLQVYIAFVLDAFYAYNKKPELLDKTSYLYSDYSLKIPEYLTSDLLLNLWLLFKRFEGERKSIKEKNNKLPIPFYAISFLGYFIENKATNKSSIKKFSTSFFNQPKEEIKKQIEFLSDLTGSYTTFYSKKMPYNDMIKQPIDESILKDQIEALCSQKNYRNIDSTIRALNK